MESSNWRKIARSPSYNALDQAAVADSHNPPGAPSISSGEDTMIREPSPSPPAQKRSYAATAADSEPLAPSKVQKLELSIPVKSASTGTGQPRPPQQPPRRSSSQGPAGPRMGPHQPSRRASTPSQSGMTPITASGFVRTHKFERRRWPNRTFQPGTIIQALNYEEHIDQQETPHSPTADNLCPFNDPRQRKVCCKDRIMVVIHQFDGHYVAVPVFSYSGRGIGWMADRRKAEYMDIHDHRNPPADNVRQNNLPALTTKQMQNWFGSIKPMSAVHYTYPKSMYYRLKVVLVGELTEESTTELINHYYDHMGRPHVTPSSSAPLQPPSGAAAANLP